MFEVKFNTKDLLEKISDAKTLIGTSNIISKMLRIKTINETQVVISYNNLVQYMDVNCKSQVIKEGEIFILVDLFLNIIQTVKKEEIIIRELEKQIEIKYGTSKFKISKLNSSEFILPTIPEIENVVTIDSKVFLRMIRDIEFATSTSVELAISGILLNIKNKLIDLVATDRNRLALKRSIVESDLIIKEILPKTTCNCLVNILSSDELQISCKDHLVKFKGKDFILVSRCLIGDYPNYENFKELENMTTISLDRIELLRALEMILVCHKYVKMIFDSNKLILYTFKPDYGEVEESCSMTIDTNSAQLNMPIVLDAFMFKDFVQIETGNTITLNLTSKSSHIFIKRENGLGIMMPVRGTYLL